MYVIFGTDNEAANPAAPGASKNIHSGPTRTVMAISDDDANTFHFLYDLSKGPGAKFIKTTIAPGGIHLHLGDAGGTANEAHAAVLRAQEGRELRP